MKVITLILYQVKILKFNIKSSTECNPCKYSVPFENISRPAIILKPSLWISFIQWESQNIYI